MPIPAGPIIAGATGLISGAIKAAQTRKNIRRQLDADKELAKFAYGQDVEQWNRANLYNDPSQQMQRLKDAGLNPNLVYGSGSAAGNTASQLPKYGTVRSDFSAQQSAIDPTTMLSQYQDIRMKNAQIDLTRNRANIEAETAIQKQWQNARTVSTKQLGPGKFAVTKSSFYKDIQTAMLRKYQQQAADIQSQAGMRALELNWWQEMKGVKGAGEIMRILKMITGPR